MGRYWVSLVASVLTLVLTGPASAARDNPDCGAEATEASTGDPNLFVYLVRDSGPVPISEQRTGETTPERLLAIGANKDKVDAIDPEAILFATYAPERTSWAGKGCYQRTWRRVPFYHGELTFKRIKEHLRHRPLPDPFEPVPLPRSGSVVSPPRGALPPSEGLDRLTSSVERSICGVSYLQRTCAHIRTLGLRRLAVGVNLTLLRHSLVQDGIELAMVSSKKPSHQGLLTLARRLADLRVPQRDRAAREIVEELMAVDLPDRDELVTHQQLAAGTVYACRLSNDPSCPVGVIISKLGAGSSAKTRAAAASIASHILAAYTDTSADPGNGRLQRAIRAYVEATSADPRVAELLEAEQRRSTTDALRIVVGLYDSDPKVRSALHFVGMAADGDRIGIEYEIERARHEHAEPPVCAGLGLRLLAAGRLRDGGEFHGPLSVTIGEVMYRGQTIYVAGALLDAGQYLTADERSKGEPQPAKLREPDSLDVLAPGASVGYRLGTRPDWTMGLAVGSSRLLRDSRDVYVGLSAGLMFSVVPFSGHDGSRDRGAKKD